MAKRWTMTHEQTEVGFEVLKVEPARKIGCAVVSVKYPTMDTVYTYVRKYTKVGNTYEIMVDGCKVVVEGLDMAVKSVTRQYDTKGLKRKSTEAHIDGKAKAKEQPSEEVEQVQLEAENDQDGTANKIKAEMANQNIPLPIVPDSPIHHEKYDQIKTCMACNIPVYLAGPAGSGKNHTVEQIAAEMGWDFYFSNSVQQEYKLTGFIDAGGMYHETEFYKACTSENECVFFLDEMDASIPDVLVLLNAAIANGYFEFPNGRVQLGNVHFVATGNTVGNGADEDYTGRMVLDQATLDRFAIIEFDYDIRVELAISKGNQELVDFVRHLRTDAKAKGIRATFSLRCLTMVTKLEATGMALATILKVAVVKGLDNDTMRTLNAGMDNKYAKALRELQRVA